MSDNKEQDAHNKGEQDFSKHNGQGDPNPIYELFNPTFDPPKGHEDAYRDGWDNAKKQK